MADESTFEPEFADIEAMLRDLEPTDLLTEDTPDDIWNRIAAELGDELELDAEPATGTVVRAPFGRRRSWATPLLAAAAAIIVVVAGVTIINSATSTTTLAEAELAYDPVAFDPLGADAAAHAALVDDSGANLIEIDDEALPFDLDEDSAIELWLIQADGAGNVIDLVSLGDIEADGTRSFPVPAGYDPREFRVVDISIEPRDGDEAHSGRSILRGALEA